MTKSDLIERLCQDQKLPKGKAELLVNTIFESLEQALARGERVEIRGFGSFELRAYKPYQGRNPKTGIPVAVKQKRLPFFKVGKELKERVNHGEETGRSSALSSNGRANGRPSLARSAPLPPPEPAGEATDETEATDDEPLAASSESEAGIHE